MLPIKTIYFRVCLFDGKRCTNYSNNVILDFSINQKPSPIPTFGHIITPKTTPIYVSIEPLPTASVVVLGDTNSDGVVDGKDYLNWKLHEGQHVKPNTNGDVDGNGIVDTEDRKIILTEMLKHFTNH
jgi:hypothetical protein